MIIIGRVEARRANGAGTVPPVYLARFVVGAPKRTRVKHLNGDRFDFRRANLKILRPAETLWSKRVKRRGKSQYVGVSWCSQSQKWRVIVHYHGRRVPVGKYDDEQTAARAYDCVAVNLRGRLTRLNFSAAEAVDFPRLMIAPTARRIMAGWPS
jgi:hypothetical protein